MKTKCITILILAFISRTMAAENRPGPLDITPMTTEANTAFNRGDFAKAVALEQSALDKIRADGGADHPAFGLLQCNLAMALVKLGKHGEGVATFRQGHGLLRKHLGDQRPDVFTIAGQFADLLHQARLDAAGADILRELEPKLEFSPDVTPLVIGQFRERLARALAALNQSEDALRMYESSRIAIAKTQDAAGADVVRIATAMDALRTKLGLPSERKFVGNLGFPSAIEFTGNKIFPAEDLRSALAGSYEYLMAAHPSAPYNDYVAMVQKLLLRGYRDAGFRDVWVTVVPSKAGNGLIADIEGGRQFLKGEIRITGAKAIPVGELIDELTVKQKPVTDSLAVRVSKFVEERAAPKRKAEMEKILKKMSEQVPSFQLGSSAPAETMPSGANPLAELQMLDSTQTPAAPEAYWKTGKPFAFGPWEISEAEGKLRDVLADRGDWLTEVKAKVDVDAATGRVNLTYHITEGPSAVIGDIIVVGNKRDTAAEIIAATGLKKGAPFTSETIRMANLALWNSARFYNFDLTPKRRDGGHPEVDIIVDVEDCPDMQPLREPLTRGQQAIVRIADWMTTEFPKREIGIKISDTAGDEAAIAFSPSAGMALLVNTKAGDQIAGLHSGTDGGWAVAGVGKRVGAREFRRPSGVFELGIRILPEPRGASVAGTPCRFSFGMGYRTYSKDGKAVAADLMFAPVACCSKAAGMSFEDGIVTIDDKNDYKIRFVEATGELVELIWNDKSNDSKGDTFSMSIGTKADEVARIRKVLEAARKGHDPTQLSEESSLGLITEAPAIRKLVGELSADLNWKDIGLAARLLERATASLLVLFTAEDEKMDEGASFSIPPDISAGTSLVAAMIGGFYFQVARELWPEDAWPSRLGRELFYITTGNTRYTPLVLDELDKDPDMGPLGSYAAAQLLEKLDRESMWRFLRRAREHSSVEDLRRELTLLLNVHGKGKDLARSVVDELAKVDADAVEQLAGMLGPEFAAEVRLWREELATAKGKDPVDVLLPHILRGWERGGRATFVKKIDAMLQGTQPDPWIAAAIVNGEPVSRRLKSLGALAGLQEFVPARPELGAKTAPDDRQRMLDALIALQLVKQEYQQKGGKVSDELFKKALIVVAGGDLPKFQEQLTLAGATQKDFVALMMQAMPFVALRAEFAASVKPPTDDELRVAIEAEPHAMLDRVHLQFIRGAKDGQTRKTIEAYRARAETSGFDKLWNEAKSKKLGEFAAGEYEDMDRDTLNEALTAVAFALDAGKTSKVIESGDYLYLLHLVSKGTSEKSKKEGREGMAAKLQQERLSRALSEHIERLRALAKITVLDLPEMPSAPPPPAGAIRIEGESLKVIGEENAKASVMTMDNWGADHWSGRKQAFVNGKDGGWVEWEIEMEKVGDFQIVLHATRATNFGKITVALDGKDFDPSLDLYADGVIPSGPRTLGTRSITKGKHKLRITVHDGHPEANGFDFGFDALDLVPTGRIPAFK